MGGQKRKGTKVIWGICWGRNNGRLRFKKGNSGRDHFKVHGKISVKRKAGEGKKEHLRKRKDGREGTFLQKHS